MTDPLTFLEAPLPQEPKPQRQPNVDPLSFLDGVGQQWAEEAQTTGEWWKFTGLGAVKELGDSFQNVANLLYQGGAGVGSMLQGQGFGAGVDAARQSLQQTYGDSNPSILDLFEPGSQIGRRTDELIDRRLGKGAIWGKTVGAVGGFILPGAPIGRTASAVTRPLAEVAERVIARGALRAAGAGDEIAKGLIDSGNAWGYLAQNPAMAANLSLYRRSLELAGRNASDLLGTTAANIAQSYAIADDDQRLNGALTAALVSPFVIPVARVGQRLGEGVLRAGLGEGQVQAARAAFERFQAGQLSVAGLRTTLADQVGLGRKAAATLLSGAFEGSAFTMLGPGAFDTLTRALGGDSDAIAEMVAMGMGNVLGVAAAKMVPGSGADQVPFFRSAQPDLNRLSTYLEAHANKQALQRLKDEPVGEVRDPAEIDPNVPEIPESSPERPDVVAEAQADARARYGWAEQHSLPLLRGNWQPEFLDTGTDVWMRFDRDHSVQLGGNAIQPTLRVTPKIEGILREFGRAPEDGPARSVITPDSIELRGPVAQQALDDLAIIGALRRMQGDSRMSRLGYREVQPGLWADDAGNFHSIQLDGSIATRDLEGNLIGRDDLRIVGRDEPPLWDSPSAQALAQWVTTKQAIAPDTIVDSMVLEAIEAARYGTSRGASELRALLQNTPPDQVIGLLGPGSDREAAFLLGSLATGNGNAMSVHGELGAIHQHRAAKALEAPADRTEHQWAQQTGEPVPMDAETAKAKERQEFLAAMEERSLADMLAQGPKPDMPTEAATGAMGGQKIRAGLEAAKKPAAKAADYLVESQALVVEKGAPDSPLPFRARRAMAERAELVGQTREQFGAAEKALKSKAGKTARKGKVPVENLSPEEGSKPAWLALADAEARPSSPAEKAIQEGFQASQRTLWEKSVEVGMTRAERTPEGVKTVPLTKRSRAVTQRVPGKDTKTVHENKTLRQAWFETLVRANPDQQIRDPETKALRKLRADDLEAEWVQDKVREVENLESEAAMEFQRRFKNVPYEWKAPDGKVYEMFETNPFRTMERITEHQASRISHVRQFGQDFPADQRAAMLADPATLPAVRANLERGGTEKALKDYAAELNKNVDQSRNEGYLAYAKQLLSRTQGTEPVKSQAAADFFRPFTAVSSAMRSAASFVLDIPEPLFRNPAYVGLGTALKAIARVARNPIEMVRQYEALGAIDRQIGDHVFTEAKGWPAKVADIAGWIASKTERWKGAIAGWSADQVIARAKAGKATINDLQVAEHILSLAPEDVLAIRRGDVSDALASQWRRELVQLITSRGRPAEGSSFAADPNVRAYIQFTQFATKRASSLLRTLASVKIAKDQHGWNSRETAVAGARLGKLLFGMGAGGLLGTALGKTLIGLFAGDPWDEGLGKFLDKTLNAPGSALWEAYKQQVIGGPASQIQRAFANPESAQDYANLTVPTGALLGLARMAQSVAKQDPWGLYQAGRDFGLIPFRQHLGNLAALAFTANSQARLDEQFVREWKRDNGIKPVFGARNKEPEFYDAIAQIEDAVNQPDATRETALQDAMAGIRKALELAPEESVAGAIEGHQLVRDIPPEKRSMLEDVASEQRMRRIYEHDAMLRALSREVRKMEGVNPTEWDAELDAVTESAALGASDRWGQLTDRALDETAHRVANRETFGDQVHDVAERMAVYPEQLESLFSKQQYRQIANPRLDTQTRARRIAAILRNRVQDRVKKIREEQRGKH